MLTIVFGSNCRNRLILTTIIIFSAVVAIQSSLILGSTKTGAIFKMNENNVSKTNPDLNLKPATVNQEYNQSDYPLSLEDIHIRDPNIFFHNSCYYMTGTTANDGFLGYSSYDLINWRSEGYIYRRNESNYWAQKSFWAPEISSRDGKFYLWFTRSLKLQGEQPEWPFPTIHWVLMKI